MRKLNKNLNNSFIVLGILFFIYSGKDGNNQIAKNFFLFIFILLRGLYYYYLLIFA